MMPEIIMWACCDEFQVSMDDLKRKCRIPRIAAARAVSMSLMVQTGMTEVEAGKIHNKTHGAVSRALTKVRQLARVNPDFCNSIRTIKAKLNLC